MKNGFTLIELMIAVAVIGILSAIAIPSYQSSMIKSRRADAQAALMNFANGMERHFTEESTYCSAADSGFDDATCPGGGLDYGGPPLGNVFTPPGKTDQYYDFKIQAATQSTYVIRATPVAGEAQATDGYLELDSIGNRAWDRDNSLAIEAGEGTWD